jgi:hypothetical protein
MPSRSLLAAAALLFAGSLPAGAVPVKFFGQDPQPVPAATVPVGGGSETARSAFLSNLAALSAEGFEALGSQSVLPAAGAPTQSYGLSFAGSAGTIAATAQAVTGAIVNTDINGNFATGGSNYLFARGTVSFDFGATPVSAFGFYINDVETIGAVTVTLTPAGGGTPVVLTYGGIVNSGTTSTVPGDGQLAFIGFIDTETAYENVVVSFPGQSANEGFGFDDLVVGDLNQVTATQRTVTQTQIVDEPGWRLLSAPVQGVTVDALAQLNLVQGVPAGDGVAQGQYPAASSNFYTAYNGGDRYDYVPAASTGTTLVPGRGFWWYWYDLDIDPDNASFGGGTSQSVTLDGFALTALGTPLEANVTESFDDNVNTATGQGGNPNPTGPGGELLPADDDFYMIGNPFPEPFSVGAISATGGTLQDAFFAWNPGNQNGTPPNDPNPILNGPGSYEVLFGTPINGGPNYAAVWQGLMAEVTSPAGPTIDFTFDIAGVDENQAPPFYGRRAAEAFVSLHLEGSTTAGARVRDAAAWLRLRDDAGLGWDRFDASKLTPPSAPYALIAPVGERDGAPYRQAVRSLPSASVDVSVPLSFAATHGGAFRLTWTGMDSFTDGRTVELTDAVTGAVVDLATATEYAFAATATDWTDRFALRIMSGPLAGEAAPDGVFVGQPAPNPAAGAATLALRLAESADVTVAVYDALGRRVARVQTGVLAAGAVHQIGLPTAGLQPGVYVVRVEGEQLRTSRRLTVLR